MSVMVPMECSSRVVLHGLRFTLEQQRRLDKLGENTSKRGIPVLISNHDTGFTREIYAGAAELTELEVQRHISVHVGNRGKAAELLALYRAE